MKKSINFLTSIINFFLSAYGIVEIKNYAYRVAPTATSPAVQPIPRTNTPPASTTPPAGGATGSGTTSGGGSGSGGGATGGASGTGRVASPAVIADANKNAIMVTGGLGVVGLLAGLGFAHYRKPSGSKANSVMAYVGFGALGLIALSGITTGVYMAKGTNIFKGKATATDTPATPPATSPAPAPQV